MNTNGDRLRWVFGLPTEASARIGAILLPANLTNRALTLFTSCNALPPEGALRLRPGKAGSAAPAGLGGDAPDALMIFRTNGDSQ
ncbi:hypothetical protein B0B52_15255 [Polaromonas sp. A23]|nr:hypothetical protein B0B52_15255 [Polaromonas sp. A23]